MRDWGLGWVERPGTGRRAIGGLPLLDGRDGGGHLVGPSPSGCRADSCSRFRFPHTVSPGARSSCTAASFVLLRFASDVAVAVAPACWNV